MKKIALTLLLALTPAAFAQSGPDAVTVDLGVTSAATTNYDYGNRPPLGLYGNVTLTEHLTSVGQGGNVWGQLKVGNDFNDIHRLFVEGKVDYTVDNLIVYGAVRQGFADRYGFANTGTSFRLGTQVRF